MTRRPALLVLLAVALAFPLRAEDLPTVPVVKTWAELSAAKPFDLGNGVSVRIGIEAAQAPRDSGVLLYVLTDGLREATLSYDSEKIGPLTVRIEPPGAKNAADEVLRAAIAHRRNWDGLALFCKAVPLAEEGDYRITFLDKDNAPLAAVTLRSEKASHHAWTKFRSVRWNEIEDAPQDGTLTGYLSYGDWLPAVPHFASTDPLRIVTPDAVKRDSPLPHLLDTPHAVEKEDPAFTAKTQALVRALSVDDFDAREKAMLELRALLPDAAPGIEKARSLAKDIESRNRLDVLLRLAHTSTLHLRASHVDSFLTFPAGLHASWPEDYFLVRWWVNDKPVILKAADERPAFDRVGAIRVAEVLRLRWKIDWALLGAKSGDRIGVQLLYCPAGVLEITSDRYNRIQTFTEFGQMPIPTNRSEFKLP
jgi:hypothetical protein